MSLSNPTIHYIARPDTTPEAELNTLAQIYSLCLQKHCGRKTAAEPTPERDSCNDAAIVRNTEGVNHIEQRPDRPSEIVVTHSRKLRTQ